VSGVAGFISVLVFSIINFFLFGKGVILDPFHQGEYFATLPTLLHSQPGAHAFTIHGGLDFIPVWLAETWFGAQHTFLVTQILYGLCNTGAALLLWGTAVLLCPVPKGRARLILLVAVGAVATQVVGYRDLFLLLSLFLFCLHRKVETTPRRLLCEVLLGLAAGFNLFWSYDRGIAGVLAIGSAVLLTLLLQRRHVLSLLSFVATVGWLGFGTDFFALTDYVKNLTFLLETSSQWGYGLSARPLALSLLLAVPTALAGFALIRCLPWPWRWSEDLPLIGALAVLLAIFFKIGVNRADFQHIQMGFWVPLLSLLYAARRQRLARNGGWDISAHPRAAAAAIAAAVLLGLVGLNPSRCCWREHCWPSVGGFWCRRWRRCWCCSPPSTSTSRRWSGCGPRDSPGYQSWPPCRMTPPWQRPGCNGPRSACWRAAPTVCSTWPTTGSSMASPTCRPAPSTSIPSMPRRPTRPICSAICSMPIRRRWCIRRPSGHST